MSNETKKAVFINSKIEICTNREIDSKWRLTIVAIKNVIVNIKEIEIVTKGYCQKNKMQITNLKQEAKG